MIQELIGILRQYWGSYKSIPVAIGLVGVGYYSLISSQNEFTALPHGRYILLGAALAVLLWYTFVCYKRNRLPCAPAGSLAVLFVVASETQKLFEAVKYKLVDSFEDAMAKNPVDGSKCHVYCIRKEALSKYNISNKEDVIKLLRKTNCVFLVDVKYLVDDADNAEQFEMQINYGVVHPTFDEQREQLLAKDMATLGTSVGKRRFVKSQTIDVFNFSVFALSHICQYILGLVFLMTSDINGAVSFFEAIKEDLDREHRNIRVINALKNLVPKRLFAAYMLLARNCIANFQKDKGIHYLRMCYDLLDKANVLYPDTYEYNLLRAYVVIALNGDIKTAKGCVEKCKASKADATWKYSDAFLSAYQGHAPSAIITKYQQAFKVEYPGLINIADYVEYMLGKEPLRKELHLAAGLIYEGIGDVRLMKRHFSLFMEGLQQENVRVMTVLKEKMDAASCEMECSNNCQACSEQQVG